MSCKTLSIKYMWKYVNCKSICVKSLFISPVLDINWRSDLVVKDRQHKAFLKIGHVLQNTGLGTLNPPLEEKVSSYVFIFNQLVDVLEELPAYLNKNRANNVEYILACY